MARVSRTLGSVSRKVIPLEQSYRLDPATGCWEWIRNRVKGSGYARLTSGNAHRWVYEQVVGPIPEGMELDHTCRNKGCVNPVHMEIVTPAENNRRKNEALGRGQYATHCPNGHAYTPENTMRVHGNARQCRVCNREAVRRWKAQNRARIRAYEREWRRARRSSAP